MLFLAFPLKPQILDLIKRGKTTSDWCIGNSIFNGCKRSLVGCLHYLFNFGRTTNFHKENKCKREKIWELSCFIREKSTEKKPLRLGTVRPVATDTSSLFVQKPWKWTFNLVGSDVLNPVLTDRFVPPQIWKYSFIQVSDLWRWYDINQSWQVL